MRETGRRTLVKTVSYRFLGEAVTFFVAYAVTGKFKYAASITAIESLIKLGTYAGHERIWTRIPWGVIDSAEPVKTEPLKVVSPIKLEEPIKSRLPLSVQTQSERSY
jgi:uncharacterized membrane protein